MYCMSTKFSAIEILWMCGVPIKNFFWKLMLFLGVGLSHGRIYPVKWKVYEVTEECTKLVFAIQYSGQRNWHVPHCKLLLKLKELSNTLASGTHLSPTLFCFSQGVRLMP